MAMKTKGLPLHRVVADYVASHAGMRLTIAEIAKGIVEADPARFSVKEKGLGSRDALLNQLTREIYAQRGGLLLKHPKISTDASKSPIRLFIDNAPDSIETISLSVEEPATSNASLADTEVSEDIREHALYEPLQRFLAQELGIVSRRIRESTSTNRRGRNGNKWLHPDIVGMLAPGQDWQDVVRQCSMAMPTRKAKLIALEVKLRLTSGTVRESFFQAVSNSLWANSAYLVATEVKGEDTFAELTTLCSLHGVGYISLDRENPSESRILIPARDREEVDWASANRIADENPDFRSFLGHVLNYLQTGKVVEAIWR
ncbi:hypothetical protein [Brevundimonas sp.]|uniref:hypothetical protein n=1 Tax=Brevundimonas sp. TaxID=1871086 RepID=UPI002899F40D|nr:hypothetical protein [Brevundimonas sp.]